ncbi:MAG: 4Fe-4S dicluster domain-containing protein, partial [Coriobacteriales bacterium]|nr:4Fe-4S dicluster domain-containing protein [Coriobacteriales bacterium]
MFETFKNILHTGNATVKYPFAPLKTQPGMRGKPEHRSVQCIACSACAIACPPNAIQMEVDTKEHTISWNINYGRCIFCGRCQEVCPVQAISLTNEFELAVMNKDDLQEESIYTLEQCNVCGSYFASHKSVDYATRIMQSQAGDADIASAIERVHSCPTCKQKRSALVAAHVPQDLTNVKAKNAANGAVVTNALPGGVGAGHAELPGSGSYSPRALGAAAFNEAVFGTLPLRDRAGATVPVSRETKGGTLPLRDNSGITARVSKHATSDGVPLRDQSGATTPIHKE